jgi:hypothetical protein
LGAKSYCIAVGFSHHLVAELLFQKHVVDSFVGGVSSSEGQFQLHGFGLGLDRNSAGLAFKRAAHFPRWHSDSPACLERGHNLFSGQ